MTKRGVPAVAIALIAALGFSGAAQARQPALSAALAKKLARKLAAKQVQGRDVVSFHLLDQRRLGRNSFAFGYDDRSASNVFCTAEIVITKQDRSNGYTVRARFRGQKCNGIPSDVLAVENVTRNAVRALRGTAAATADSLDALGRSIDRCRNLEVPRARRAAVNAVVDVALVEALEGPNDAAIG